MGHFRFGLVLMVISALIACGCQSAVPVQTIAEYRPAVGPSESLVPYSDVYLLWKWVPAPYPSPHQQPVQIAQAYADRGSPVGFRRSNGQLIAIAGATTQPLIEAHYTWQTLPGEVGHMDQPPSRRTDLSDTADCDVNTGSPILDFLSDLLDAAFDSLFNGDDSHGGHHDSPNHDRDDHHREKSHDSQPQTRRKPPASQPSP